MCLREQPGAGASFSRAGPLRFTTPRTAHAMPATPVLPTLLAGVGA